jgi:hypothetical protein
MVFLAMAPGRRPMDRSDLPSPGGFAEKAGRTGFHFRGKRFMVPRYFACGKVILSI